MDIKNVCDEVIFTSSALIIKDALLEAVCKNADLRNANLRNADLRHANLRNADLYNANLSNANLRNADLRHANLRNANLYNADLSNADLYNANLSNANLYNADLSNANLSNADLGNANGKEMKIYALSVFVGLYRYEVWAVLCLDGTRYVRMGCIFKSLEDWEKVGIRNSNLSEFPDDKSLACEERVAAFEFAKAAALRMNIPEKEAEPCCE